MEWSPLAFKVIERTDAHLRSSSLLLLNTDGLNARLCELRAVSFSIPKAGVAFLDTQSHCLVRIEVSVAGSSG